MTTTMTTTTTTTMKTKKIFLVVVVVVVAAISIAVAAIGSVDAFVTPFSTTTTTSISSFSSTTPSRTATRRKPRSATTATTAASRSGSRGSGGGRGIDVQLFATNIDRTTADAWKGLTQKMTTTTATTTTTTAATSGSGSTATTATTTTTDFGGGAASGIDFDMDGKIQNVIDKIWHYDFPITPPKIPTTMPTMPTIATPELHLPTTTIPSLGIPSLQNVVDKVMETTSKATSSIGLQLPQFEPPGGMITIDQQQYDIGVLSSSVLGFITASFLLTTVLNWNKSPPLSSPYPQGRYDPFTAREYFQVRPWLVVQRSFVVFSKALSFLTLIAFDKATSSFEKNAEIRSVQLAKLLSELGPAFIKIGQSLSIRSDILSPEYMRGLATLQDKVEPFDSKSALDILEQEWGVPLSQVLSIESLPSEPIAAASLGQVYKASLKRPIQVTTTGKKIDSVSPDPADVDASSSSSSSSTSTETTEEETTMTIDEIAIKVQRPDIQNQIALDMHLLREAAGPAKSLFNLNTDTVGLVDAWGAGFVDELDYRAEADNAISFSEQIQSTPLKDVVLAPCPIDDLTTDKVLVTQWIDGTRLDQSSSDDVTILCSICMNTYLTMLLEFGLLHCDPHPGNLLRTPDGKLSILDWGMVTEIPPELQLTLIEHMAHLTSGDYAEVPRDLYLLGFIPADKEQEIEDAGVVDVLADVYGQWTAGGGLRTINANEVFASLQDLAGQKGNLFQIPPYFAYIAKSFSVLEGIGLSNDPEYSIINECLPYVSNRLLTDKDTMGNALSTFIFGPNKGNIEERLVDYDRVEQLVKGFGSFASSAQASSDGHKTSSDLVSDLSSDMDTDRAKSNSFEQVADQVLDLVLAEEETPLQAILIEQLAKIVSASGRTFWTEARKRSGVLPNGRSLLGTAVDPLGLFRSSSLVNACDMDEKTLKLTSQLIELIRSELAPAPAPTTVAAATTTTTSVPAATGGAITSSSEDSSPSSDSNLNPLFSTNLSRQDLTTFSVLLSRKIWERRDALVRSNSLFWKQMLSLTASRLESKQL